MNRRKEAVSRDLIELYEVLRERRGAGPRIAAIRPASRGKTRFGSHICLSRQVDSRGRGLRMFLFGSERTYIKGQPLRVLDQVWATPGDRDRHSLLE
jgi:hypothetical protein